MQHLLGRAKWDADQVRDDARGYVVEHLHDDQAVPVVDETGDVKKGTGTVGVQCQYTGTAGRIENSQVAVYLVYAGQRGHAAVDRELYVPRSWTSDPDRCRAAGLAEKTTFATSRNWQLAWSPGSWTPATRPHGLPVTRSTAALVLRHENSRRCRGWCTAGSGRGSSRSLRRRSCVGTVTSLHASGLSLTSAGRDDHAPASRSER